MTDPSALPPARLFTTWGTVLYVEAASGQLRHGAIETSPANAVFVANATAFGERRQGWIMHASVEAFDPIVCGVLSCCAVSHANGGDPPPVPTLLELVPLERGLIAFRAGGLFLCAQPDGRLQLVNPVCSTWECFLASEDWCSAAAATGDEHPWKLYGPVFDKRRIAGFIVDARLRAKANAASKATKILIYGYPAWSHGRVYYDICKHLHGKGYIVDIINWQVNHAGYMAELTSYYDLFISALDGIRTLVEVYGLPTAKILGLSHHALDIRVLIDQMGVEIFERLAGYGVVGYQLYDASVIFGVRRHPLVVHLGVNFDELCTDIPERLETLGYAGSFSQQSVDGIELKRGALAEKAAREAGLDFKVAGSTADQISFHDMPAFYKSVDAVLVSSVTEGAGLPAREGAAAGRLVISTPVGDFPLRASQGLGIVAPIESHKYKKFVTATLKYYKDNPTAFADFCRKTQDAARQLDWQYMIGDWMELIESAIAHLVDGASTQQGGTLAAVLPEGGSDKKLDHYEASPDVAILHEVHLINLDGSVERLTRFTQRNSHLNFLRVTAVDGLRVDKNELIEDGVITNDLPYFPGTLGCALSHVGLWRKAVTQNRIVTIFEDDVLSSCKFLEESAKIISELPRDWDLIQWGYNYNPSFLWLDCGIAKAKLESYDCRLLGENVTKFQTEKFSYSPMKLLHSIGALAYTISPKGARSLIEYCLPLRRRVIPFPGTNVIIDDNGIDCAMCGAYGSMQAFICIPPLVVHDDGQASARIEADQETSP